VSNDNMPIRDEEPRNFGHPESSHALGHIFSTGTMLILYWEIKGARRSSPLAGVSLALHDALS
jgi:hypothetical protein